MTTYLFLIDPEWDADSAFAVGSVENIIPTEYGRANRKAIYKKIEKLAGETWDTVYLAVEDQYLDTHKTKSSDPKALARLGGVYRRIRRVTEERSRIEGVAEHYGCIILEPVNASKWQHAILKGMPIHAKTSERKRRSVEYAQMFDRKIKDHNIADVFNMWMFVLNRLEPQTKERR